MTIAFRPAKLDDVGAIRALVESAYRGDSARAGWTHEADMLSGERTSDDEVAGVIADPAQRIVVAIEDGALIGSVAITSKPPRHCYLGMLAVSPARQAGGLGRQLIAAAEAEARRAFGAAVMEMTVIDRRAELIAWYERRGYHRTGETRPFPVDLPEAAGLTMVVLERLLD
ncbi:GNAT family N-acetyltransferase [Novosphingobium piscinae]|uniref:GNAT family N-acetyltransferase n=1 Tax=Novosphingobium piscinae TaxID=1507448 RepID=A0A7X1FXW9_9SPHN|nr:GNAT family N-acetyltransferase [Novosphingobium piscinae]MBC2668958.1 GNAT family N-acetyltransferase [Novosphingobium piscinae]